MQLTKFGNNNQKVSEEKYYRYEIGSSEQPKYDCTDNIRRFYSCTKQFLLNLLLLHL